MAPPWARRWSGEACTPVVALSAPWWSWSSRSRIGRTSWRSRSHRRRVPWSWGPPSWWWSWGWPSWWTGVGSWRGRRTIRPRTQTADRTRSNTGPRRIRAVACRRSWSTALR
ncbi:hypothetical protein H257_00329 [Aphanomyces astaci]|uniref:Uncharacterized protein n=1 Tax=Aphanomyces astaci TaxID=112090 RepID=W4HC35_APHAT|nr:hypothetical protein H257_00329 [Aphanomyces astaci]ETV88849.1 hypothetical protein H257_00329 [Aphanomyces astaci]|eukprot:XP_009821249.1 hypothetical protein H257_00329 [Aphanomyces astaci]